MSYMLQFPPSRLPKDVTSPPYVLFGINDFAAFTDLPTNIPLALVLHLAPVLRKWVLPPPELSQTAICISLRTPYVGINILADMELEGLGWILARMMQIANMKIPTANYEMFQTVPSMLVSIAIHKAWLALELPPKGIEALHMHIRTTLMIGPAVTLFEIKGVWHNFPVDSPIQREMGLNFVRNYIDRRYPTSESSAIRHWYLETTERWSFFRELEKQAPAFGDVQKETMKAASEWRKTEELYVQKLFKVEKEAIASLENEKAKRHETRRERKEKHDRDRESRASMRRLERARSGSLDSISSVETTIWNPLSPGANEDPTTPTTENGGPVLTHSQPINSSDLINLLAAVAIDEQMLDDPYAAEPKLLEEARRIEEERVAIRRTVEGEADEEEFHETMEYIPPDLTSPTKLKLKSTSHSIPKEKKYKARRHAMYETNIQHGPMVEQAFTPAAGVLSIKPQSDIKAKDKKAVYSDGNLSPEETMTLSPKNVNSPRNTMNTITTENGTLSHQTLEEELASINDAIDQMAAQQQTEDGQGADVGALDDNVLEGADGLVYLQPAVYEGAR
jgi:hypothetical protein